MSDLFTFCKHPDQPVEAEADLCEACLPWLGFVKVEPCVHGNYAHHAVIELQQVDASGREDWRYVGECNGYPDEVNYPTGAVLRSAELAAEDADPELHHHEVTHSHPFTNLGHTHDQPKLEVSDV